MEEIKATYICSPYTGLLFKAKTQFVDPGVAFRNRFREFHPVLLFAETLEIREILIKLKPGEWFHG